MCDLELLNLADALSKAESLNIIKLNLSDMPDISEGIGEMLLFLGTLKNLMFLELDCT